MSHEFEPGKDLLQPPDSPSQLVEIDLVAYFLLLVRNIRVILSCGLVTSILMLLFLLLAKPQYAATAVVIVPQGNDKAAALEAKLSAQTADLLGSGFELYSDILESRTVADRIIARFNLEKVYHTKNRESAEIALATVTKIVVQPEGLMRITVKDGDPQRAADIANDYVNELGVVDQSLLLTSVAQRRAYLQREMVKEKDQLANAEVAVEKLQEGNRGLGPEAHVSEAMTAIVSTRAQLRAAQIRLESLLVSETDANPDVVRARREVEGLSAQLVQLESGNSSSATSGTPTSQVPQEVLQYTRLLRDVKYHESLFNLLEAQFGQAELEESKTPDIVQLLDPAVRPLHKVWPPRTLYFLISIFVGLLMGVFLVSMRALIKTFADEPQNSAQIGEIKHAFWRGITFRS